MAAAVEAGAVRAAAATAGKDATKAGFGPPWLFSPKSRRCVVSADRALKPGYGTVFGPHGKVDKRNDESIPGDAQHGDLWKNAAENSYADRSNSIRSNAAFNASPTRKNASLKAAKMLTSREWFQDRNPDRLSTRPTPSPRNPNPPTYKSGLPPRYSP